MKDKRMFIFIGVAVLIILLIGIFRPREVDWSPTFTSSDKIPYGTYILYNSLGDLFGKDNVSETTAVPYNMLTDESYENTSLVFVQDVFTPGEMDTRELLSFVEDGNTVFISAGRVGGKFAEELHISGLESWAGYFMNTNTADTATDINFTNPELKSDTGYQYKNADFSTYYNLTDTTVLKNLEEDSLLSSIDVLGTTHGTYPIFIRLKYGEGTILLHNLPYAFTNYYMLKPSGSDYAAKCLSYIPQGKVIWNEYYKRGDHAQIQTPLHFIFSNPELKWAYYLAIASLILYVLFNIKREQRKIPIADPYRNTSLEFVQTVGDLYYAQRDHRDIAAKKINYLMEFIRNRYYINTSEWDAEFARKLSYKSGIELKGIEHLLAVMGGIQRKKWISDTELIELNHVMDYFKNNCQ